MAQVFLAPFDRSRDFIAQRDFLCRGISIRIGRPFNKSGVSTRTLRLLYDSRAIGYVEDRKTQRRPVHSVVPSKPYVPMSDDDKAQMVWDHTRKQLDAIATTMGITTTVKESKADVVELIAKKRDESAGL